MMSFCKRSVHSFLDLPNIGITSTNCTNTSNFSQDSSQSHRHSSNIPSPAAVSGGGLTFFAVSGDIPRPINVIESSTFKPPSLSFPAMVKRDPGGVGFLDDVSGSVDGLMSCTESLGFESSDERRVDDKIENNINDGMKAAVARSKKVKKREVRKFPPPLSSLGDDGKPTFFLRPVRKDGRLELTEVNIHWPKIFRASRQDGRLRLHLVLDETEDDDDVDNSNNPIVDDEVVQDENEEDEANVEERVEGWQFPVSSAGGEGLRRCHEAIVGHRHHHHLHNLHGWGQHCVTIR